MKKKIAVLFLVFSMVFISCDQEFNTIGADLVGDEHFDFDKYEVQGLKAYSVKTGEVQTNNLPINPLGFYDNPYFGQTKANFVTQLSLVTPQPNFGTSVQVENVTLYVPYFSTVKTTNEDGSREFTLDSIYSKTEAGKISKMKLNVYENGYYLSSFGGANQDVTAKYYSDMDNVIDAQKRGHNNVDGTSVSNGVRLNDNTNIAENDQFFFNKAEIIIYKQKFNTGLGILQYVDANDQPLADQSDTPAAIALRVVKERLAPGIYLTLNKAFFKKKILDASASNLFNNNNFRQYFKGLYFQMEQVAGQEGAMAMLNFTNAKLNINYSSIDAGQTVASSKTFLLNLGLNKLGDVGNTVSLQDFTYSGAYDSGLTASNQTTGMDSKLFIKGGKGSLVYIDVFGDADVLGDDGQPYVNPVTLQPGNDVPDELDLLRLKGWLINDAYLEFYVDKDAMSVNSKYQEAERLYLFDATNQKALADYAFDSSTSPNPKRNRFIYDGIVQRDVTADKKAVKYRIRISQHINNIINSTNVNINKNVKLGLCITESIAVTGNYYYKTPISFTSGPDIEFFPVASIMAQQGVVLHGTNPALSADADKKLKLTIHFTKPN
jgi:hypothetical protein